MFLSKTRTVSVMRVSSVTRVAGLGLLVAMLCGCGGRSDFPTAPVSGVVTFNGKPLAGANVAFEPRKSGKGNLSGPGSYGTTDAEGRFRLTTIRDEEGAVVGKHRVSIRTFRAERGPDGGMQIVAKEKLPAKYHEQTTLTAEVPEEGTDAANFEL